MLTDTQIRRAKPREKPYKLADSGGLYLQVGPGDGRYWRLKYRVSGREKKLAFGVYPDVSLAEARDKRDSARKFLSQGIDPSAVRREHKRLAILNAANTFEAIASEWVEQQRARWTPGHTDRVKDSLTSEVYTSFGSVPIASITAQDILAVVKKVEARGALDVASRVLQRVTAVFRYAVQTGRIETNPAVELRGVLKSRKVQHRHALKASDLPAFLQSLKSYGGDPVTVLALRLIMLTFVRPGELRGARWEEFNLERREWRIPAARMKMRHEHVVPLSHQALEVLDALRPITGGGELLFPSRNGNGKQMSENTLTYAIYRMGYHSRATAHGFRATASTILNEQGWKPDVIERQLAHLERNKVRAAYHRSEYLQDREKMMQAWADYLDGIEKGAEVVHILRRA